MDPPPNKRSKHPNGRRIGAEFGESFFSNFPIDSDWTVDNLDSRYMQGPWRSKWYSTVNPQPFIAPDVEDDAVTPRPTEPTEQTQSTPFPEPALSLPPPTLEFDFRMSVTLNPQISIGNTPSGQRNWISFSGGSWSGSFGSGIVLPGGQDSQIVHPNSYTEVKTHYLLATDDSPPAHIVVQTSGWRTGPADVLNSLRDPDRADNVDPRMYKFRLFISMETGDKRYAEKVNAGMWIGSGMRKGNEVIYDAYRVS